MAGATSTSSVPFDRAFIDAMAPLALERAEHEELRTLAGDIIRAQEAEIEILQPHAGGHHGS